MCQENELERVVCDLCGSASAELLCVGQDRLHGLRGRFTTVKCQRCSLVYLNPRPTFSSLKQYYPEEYHCYQDGQNRNPERMRDRIDGWTLSSLPLMRLGYSARRQWFGYPARPGEGGSCQRL